MSARRIPASLMPVDDYRWETFGWLLEPEHTLILRGRLTPVTVGRRRYYLRRDIEALTGGAS